MKFFKVFFLILLVGCLLFISCDNQNNSSSQEIQQKKPELIIDKDNIATINNASDSEILAMGGNPDQRKNAGSGLKGVFSYNKIDLEEGYRYRYIYSPKYTYASFFSYFVLRKGTDNSFFIVDYKVEDDGAGPNGERLYRYEYRCFRYFVSEHYLKLEKCEVIFDDVLDYVNNHKK